MFGVPIFGGHQHLIHRDSSHSSSAARAGGSFPSNLPILSNSPPSSQSHPRRLKPTCHLPLNTPTPADRDSERDLDSDIIIASSGLRIVDLPRRYGSDGGMITVPSIPTFNNRLHPTSSGSANLGISSPYHHAESSLLGVLPPRLRSVSNLSHNTPNPSARADKCTGEVEKEVGRSEAPYWEREEGEREGGYGRCCCEVRLEP